jgi:Na+/H+ antiporter NhaD/arsenite permease-like protein
VAARLLEDAGYDLSFNRFARTGFPIMLLFLSISSAYLALLLY